MQCSQQMLDQLFNIESQRLTMLEGSISLLMVLLFELSSSLAAAEFQYPYMVAKKSLHSPTHDTVL